MVQESAFLTSSLVVLVLPAWFHTWGSKGQCWTIGKIPILLGEEFGFQTHKFYARLKSVQNTPWTRDSSRDRI